MAGKAPERQSIARAPGDSTAGEGARPPPGLRNVDDLIDARLIQPDQRALIARVGARYAIAITPAMARLIDPHDPHDPIALQFVPQAQELLVHPLERTDPIGDDAHSPVAGIVHRYPDRVLLKLVQACAVYCRFCFRRESVGPGKAQALAGAALEDALAYIRRHNEIWEVILTGGDPLILSPRRLAQVMAELGAIDHVKVIRFHTRIPVVQPERIEAKLIAALRASGKAVWIALHANHPRELDAPARAACARLIDAGFAMVSQTVLLRGVNDQAPTLEALMRAFVECRIKPYYLHHGDLAPGTAHLRTTIEAGQALMRALRGRVSGLCQPDYVLDLPGGYGKVPVGPNYLAPAGAEEGEAPRRWRVSDYCGEVHLYPPDGASGA